MPEGLNGGVGPVASGVIVALVLMSVASGAIVFGRWRALHRESVEAGVVLRDLGRTLETRGVADGLALLRGRTGVHLASAMAAALTEWSARSGRGDDPDLVALAARDALRDATAQGAAEMEKGLSTLATIGSTAPFIGLFGTTFGILNAFASIAKVGAGGLTVIASGVSEALITTALGLFVAIPAVWFYNLLVGRVATLAAQTERAGGAMLRALAREGA